MPEKTASKKQVVSTNFRPTARERINALDGKALVRIAKQYGVVVSRYAKLPPGLAKMNITNSIIGSAVRAVQKEGKAEKQVLASLK